MSGPWGGGAAAVHLGARRLIKLDGLGSIQVPDGLEQAQRSQADHVGGIERLVERDTDVALGTRL